MNTSLILTGGHRVGITRIGHGMPLVFLHGFTTHSGGYRDLFNELAHGGFEVIAIDMAGHGRTTPLPLGHSFADVRELLARTLDALDVRHAVMVGHSLGGRLVTDFAATYPHRVAHAVLLNAAVGRDFDALDVSAGLLASAPLRLVGAAVDLLADTPWLRPHSALRYLLRLSEAAPTSLAGIVAVGWAAKTPQPSTAELLGRMRRCAVPTTVIHSRYDMIVTFRNGCDAARHSGGTLVPVAGFHNWPMAHPHRAAETILAALGQRTGSTAA